MTFEPVSSLKVVEGPFLYKTSFDVVCGMSEVVLML